MRYGPDPITEDPAEIARREDEEAREQRWTAFIARIKPVLVSEGTPGMLEWLAAIAQYEPGSDLEEWLTAISRYEPGSDFERVVVDFAETEGWSGVLSALGRALREVEQERRELMDRR